MVTEQFLIDNGFVKCKNVPDGVNRYEKSDGDTHFTQSYWVSITLSGGGDFTLYGVVNFLSSDGHGYIVEHRSFDGVKLSKEDFSVFIARYASELPKYIRTTKK